MFALLGINPILASSIMSSETKENNEFMDYFKS